MEPSRKMNLTVTKDFRFYLGPDYVTIAKAAAHLSLKTCTLASRIRNQRMACTFDREFLLSPPLSSEDGIKSRAKLKLETAQFLDEITLDGKLLKVYRPTVLTVDGETIKVRRAAEIFGVPYTTLGHRLQRLMLCDGTITLEQCFQKGKLEAVFGRDKDVKAKRFVPDPHMHIPQVKLSNEWLRAKI